MVFGFFTRKPAPTAPAEMIEAGPSNSAPLSTVGPIVSPEFQFPAKQQQLHTPSPSIDLSATTNANSETQALAKPKKPRAPRAKPKPKPTPKETSPTISDIPPGPADTPSPPPDDALVTDSDALHALVASVPAQTLHAYTLAHLHPIPPSPFSLAPNGAGAPAPIVPPTPQILTALTTFFASLAPPPKLHCVRCHRGYFELENSDTACRVPHDDDSAIVERVGLGQGAGTQYETLWGCCERTVEGDGDMGPPDGWCYEGAHTTDPKRARFRADSTPHDDKLMSCARMRCGMPPRSSMSRVSRKRSRRAMEDKDEDDDEQSVASSSHTHSRTHSRSISTSSAKAKGKMKASQNEENEEEESQSRPAKRSRARKVSIASTKKDKQDEAQEAEEEGAGSAEENAMDVDDPSPPSPPKSPKRTRKSATTPTKPKSSSGTDRSMPAPPSPKSRPQSIKPRSSTSTRSVQRSPLSASFVPAPGADASVVYVRPESPTRKPSGRAEAETGARSPPKGGLLAKASVGNLKAKASAASLRSSASEGVGVGARTGRVTRARPLAEVVDTSVDGEGWS